ncbi:protein canopy homolog 2 [Patella vulgata]|uniref:protein canopy homolog 2 n=1 Tax=Patella vulgata TaxID=6465 RepID=UPI0024A8BA04|nr:protein canopy homolog 2 [Patella vulgata]XP_050401343.2 protein canopy homolog 2 [Patella vulgata]XP_050401344.2 protein canopy homolog 2 [Patella vulgata]XP_055956690.1 protein canopy homolog 2 [Patella vulgata]
MNLKSVLLYIASYFVISVDSKRDKQLYCAVCRALVDEINWSISEVDPKKTVQVGSFRVDTHGNQAISEKPYARSETHLTELMEGICHKMDDYVKTTDVTSGRTSVVRTTSRTGKALSLKNLSTDKESQKTIKFYCESVIEDHEEDMIGLFKREVLPEIEKAICGDIVSACTGEDLNIPLPTAAAEEESESLIQDVDDDDTEEDDDNLSELEKEEL